MIDNMGQKCDEEEYILLFETTKREIMLNEGASEYEASLLAHADLKNFRPSIKNVPKVKTYD